MGDIVNARFMHQRGVVVVDAAPGDWQEGRVLLGGHRERALLDTCQTAPSALAR
jgi:hypothetical protein